MKRSTFLLWLIFALTLAIRLKFAFSTANFSSDNAYFILRQVEHITHQGIPLFTDTLSHAGRTLLFNPLFMYVLAFFNVFLPLHLVAKILPNIFISSIVFIIYRLVIQSTNNENIALLGAVISPFIPIFFVTTLNDISVFSLIIPLLFLSLYYFVNIKHDKKYGIKAALTISAIALLHPSSIIYILAFVLYYIFIKVEGLQTNQAENEVMIFSTLFIIFSQFLIFRNALLLHGTHLLTLNIPPSLLQNYFQDFTLLQATYQIGLIPLFYGIYVIYRYLFREHQKNIYLFISFVFAAGILLWFKLIPFTSGLMILGSVLLLLFAQRFKLSINYIQKTKFAKWESYFLALIFTSFLLTSILPAIVLGAQTTSEAYSDNEIEAFTWLQNTPESSIILSKIDDGHLITHLGKRKNVMDSNFLMIANTQQRAQDIERLYTTFSQTEAYTITAKYNVNYIIFSESIKEYYQIHELDIFDRKCLKTVYKNDEVRIFEVLCKVEEVI